MRKSEIEFQKRLVALITEEAGFIKRAKSDYSRRKHTEKIDLLIQMQILSTRSCYDSPKQAKRKSTMAEGEESFRLFSLYPGEESNGPKNLEQKTSTG